MTIACGGQLLRDALGVLRSDTSTSKNVVTMGRDESFNTNGTSNNKATAIKTQTDVNSTTNVAHGAELSSVVPQDSLMTSSSGPNQQMNDNKHDKNNNNDDDDNDDNTIKRDRPPQQPKTAKTQQQAQMVPNGDDEEHTIACLSCMRPIDFAADVNYAREQHERLVRIAASDHSTTTITTIRAARLSSKRVNDSSSGHTTTTSRSRSNSNSSNSSSNSNPKHGGNDGNNDNDNDSVLPSNLDTIPDMNVITDDYDPNSSDVPGKSGQDTTESLDKNKDNTQPKSTHITGQHDDEGDDESQQADQSDIGNKKVSKHTAPSRRTAGVKDTALDDSSMRENDTQTDEDDAFVVLYDMVRKGGTPSSRLAVLERLTKLVEDNKEILRSQVNAIHSEQRASATQQPQQQQPQKSKDNVEEDKEARRKLSLDMDSARRPVVLTTRERDNLLAGSPGVPTVGIQPLCAHCTATLTKVLENELEESRATRESYAKYLATLREEENSSRYTVTEMEIQAAFEKERRARQQLAQLHDERQQLDAELDKVQQELAALDSRTSAYWAEVSELQRVAVDSVGVCKDVRQELTHVEQQLARLMHTNVYNDAFRIWHDGPFGTINGFRLGRLVDERVDNTEINTALGFSMLLLSTIAEKLGFEFRGYRLLPCGSTSRIEVIGGGGGGRGGRVAASTGMESTEGVDADTKTQGTTTGTMSGVVGGTGTTMVEGGDTTGTRTIGAGAVVYELFMARSSMLSSNMKTSFQPALRGFVACVEQLGQYAEAQDSQFRLPYRVERGRVEGVAVHRLHCGADAAGEVLARWTRSMKQVLIDLKWLLAFCCARLGTGSGGSTAVSTSTATAMSTAARNVV